MQPRLQPAWLRLSAMNQSAVSAPKEAAKTLSAPLSADAYLFLVAPCKKGCSEKTDEEYHPNNQRPR